MKAWAYAAIVVALIAGIGGVYKAGHSSGYDKRDGEVQQQIITAQEDARVQEETKWRDTVAAAEAEIIIEERIVEKIRVVEKQIPKVVERIVEVTPECADLGDSYAGLLNEQIRAGNNIQDTEAATGLVERVPGT